MNETNRTIRTKGKCKVCGRPAILTEDFCSVVCYHLDTQIHLNTLNEIAKSMSPPPPASNAGGSGGGKRSTVPPEANSLLITSNFVVSGSATGSYTYYDANGDPEGTSTFKWYRSDDTVGTNKTQLVFTTTEIPISASEEDKYLVFEVTPVSTTAPQTGIAAEVYSSATSSGV